MAKLTHPFSFNSIQSIAEMLDVSIKTVRRWIIRGELPAHKLGNQWRVSSLDLDVFLKLRRK
jgi:excisionase family DNA binding protein